MRTRKVLLIMICLLNLSWWRPWPGPSAHGESSLSLSSGVVADPGQRIPLSAVLSSPDSVAGLDMLLQFDPAILINTRAEFLTRFQYVSYDNSLPGRLTIVARRHHPDSTYLPPLPPGSDTVGLIWVDITTQDLLVDVETPMVFFDDPATPFSDNRLVRPDSTFISPPELSLYSGYILIRHSLYGDVNDDGYAYTIADAIFFFNFLVGSQELTSRQRANSDVNRDGVQTSMADFIHLLNVIVEE